jgi:hypothetical protein
MSYRYTAFGREAMMAGSTRFPKFFFRIEEVREHENTTPLATNGGHWIPTHVPGGNVRTTGGASHIHWYCNGVGIEVAGSLPEDAQPYKQFSVFFSGGHGFQVLYGDATSPPPGSAWHPLGFEHHNDDNYSSSLTNAGQQTTLRCHRINELWTRMLLPDIYHGPAGAVQGQGGLRGELPIFLALIAFAMPVNSLVSFLPRMLERGTWQAYHMMNGRDHMRGVIVTIWSYPSRRRGDTNAAAIQAFEDEPGRRYYS